MSYEEMRRSFIPEQDLIEVKADQAKNIFGEIEEKMDERIQAIEIQLQNPEITQATLEDLNLLARHGYAKKVFEMVGTRLIPCERYNPLLRVLIKNGFDKEVLDLAQSARIDWLSYKNANLVEALIKIGNAQEIFLFIQDKVNLSSSPHRGILQTLAENGLAPQLMEQFGHQLDPNSIVNGAFLGALADAGFADVLLEQVKDTLTLAEPRNPLFYVLMRKGKGTQLLEIFKNQIDVENPLHLRFLTALVNTGYHGEVKSLFGTHLKRENPDQSALLNTIAEKEQALEEREIPTQLPETYPPTEQDFVAANFSSSKKNILDKLFHDSFPNMPELDPAKEKMKNLLSQLGYQELKFLKLGIDKYGSILHPKVQAAIKRFFDGKQTILEMNKTGSHLYIFVEPTQGVSFVNDIPKESADTWKMVHDAGIPVAPITKDGIGRKDATTRVYSRYCGLSVGEIRTKLLAEEEDEDIPKDIPFHNLSEFYQYLLAECQKIRQEINKVPDATDPDKHMAVTHGHTHFGNMTVEFVRKPYYDKHMETSGNINTLPFTPEDVNFDLSTYLAAPEEWTPVVRLIDWDQSQSSLSQAA